MLAVVVSDVEVDGEYRFERIRYGSTPEHLRLLAEWLITQQVEEVVMESTAQYWKPVWGLGTIVSRLQKAASAEDVTRIVHEEFGRWFGAESTTGPKAAYSAIGYEVWSLLSSKHRPRLLFEAKQPSFW